MGKKPNDPEFQTVFVLTNEFWQKFTKNELDAIKKERESIPGEKFSVYEGDYDTELRHVKARMKVQEIRKMTRPTADEIKERKTKAPNVPSLVNYKLIFG